jgi:hypothetical protein
MNALCCGWLFISSSPRLDVWWRTDGPDWSKIKVPPHVVVEDQRATRSILHLSFSPERTFCVAIRPISTMANMHITLDL